MKFLKRTPRKKIFIVPTRHGFLYAAVVSVLFFLLVQSPNSSLLTLLATLITLGMTAMYLTHSNLENLKITQGECKSSFYQEPSELSIRVQCPDQTPLLSIEIFKKLWNFLPGQNEFTSIPLPLQKRGRYTIQSIRISTLYPLGLFYSWTYWEQPFEYFVYPQKLSASEFRALLCATTAREGQEDFIGHQFISPSEEVRHSARQLDWKIFARTQTLQLKLFNSTPTLPTLLDWHTCPGNSTEAKLSFLATAIYELNKNHIPFTLKLPQIILKAGTDAKHYRQCLEALAEFQDPDEGGRNSGPS